MFTLDRVVPWGRSYEEYCRMFALTDADLERRIVGCADGPASFNAELTRRGGRVTSCDPIYRWDAGQLHERILEARDQILHQTRLNAHEFVWSGAIRSVDELGHLRMAAMQTFLADYEAGRKEGRYVDASLPSLPFPDAAFDLALCSHFLFLYESGLDRAFHHAAIHEMCRVAKEVRVFPLLTLGGRRSSHVASSIHDLEGAGFDASIEPVPYEFQRGGHEMLRVRRRACEPTWNERAS
jgi:hypothetical protein